MIAPTTRPLVAWVYSRVSSALQAESGLSLEAQKNQIRAYFDLLNIRLTGTPLVWGGVFVDDGVSAYSIPFARRKAGGELNLRLQKGDHLIFSRLDRAFRRVADAATMTATWLDRGVTVHYLDFSIDTSNAFGRFALSMMANVAEFESAVKSERMLAVNGVRRAKGHVITHPPMGFKCSGKKLVPCEYTRAICSYVLYCRDVLGTPWRTIARDLTAAGRVTNKNNGWSDYTVNTAYKVAKKLELQPCAEMPPRPFPKRND